MALQVKLNNRFYNFVFVQQKTLSSKIPQRTHSHRVTLITSLIPPSTMNGTINYSMQFTISEIRDLIKVEKKYILDCLYHFSDFFSKNAIVSNNSEKKFNKNDIRVFAYVLLLWEENPDYEQIRFELNAGCHLESYLNDIIKEATPIFVEPSDELLNQSNMVLIGGMANLSDKFTLAKSYKKSGDELIRIAIENDEKNELFYPAVYCYRHSIELFLKSVILKKCQHHDLEKLYENFEQIIKTKFGIDIPKWFKNIILALHEFDPSSTTFRYGEQIPIDEHFVDLNHFKNLMDLLENSFERIKENI